MHLTELNMYKRDSTDILLGKADAELHIGVLD